MTKKKTSKAAKKPNISPVKGVPMARLKFPLPRFWGAVIECDNCKDLLWSLHVHDYKSCTCGSVFIDGGAEYCRMGGNGTHGYKIIDEGNYRQDDWNEKQRVKELEASVARLQSELDNTRKYR